MSTDAPIGNRLGLLSIWRMAILGPGALLALPSEQRPPPLAFALLCHCFIGVLVGLMVLGFGFAAHRFPVGVAVGATLLIIGMGLLGVLLTAVLAHLARGADRPFHETWTVCCYTIGATAVLPVFGSLIRLVTLPLGLRAIPGTSRGRAVFAALFALLVSEQLVSTWLRGGLIESFKVPSSSSVPTLQVGDHIFVTKFSYGLRLPWFGLRVGEAAPARADTIIFSYPKEPDKDFVKRVIAIGGDVVDIRGQQVYVNGQPIMREALPGPCSYGDYDASAGAWQQVQCEAFLERNGASSYVTITDPGSPGHSVGVIDFPYTVPPRSAFVMGDNRDNSHDSRYWGPVAYDLIKGKVWLIWWSSGRDQLRWERMLQLVR